MKKFEYYFDKLFVKQWSIGIARADFFDCLVKKKLDLRFTWLNIPAKDRFYADPFVLNGRNGQIHIFYEDIKSNEQYGKVALVTLDSRFSILSQKVLLDTGSHLSYPFLLEDNNRIYILPEASASGKLVIYEFNSELQVIQNPVELIPEPLVDATILKHNSKYWLFATKRGPDVDRKLFLYFADDLLGPYKEHPENPVKSSLTGSRPAGAVFEFAGDLFRPAQNSENFYGESVTVQKILRLTEEHFEETDYMTITPGRQEKYNRRLHTLNFTDNIVVVDGLKRYFLPFNRLRFFLKKKRQLHA